MVSAILGLKLDIIFRIPQDKPFHVKCTHIKGVVIIVKKVVKNALQHYGKGLILLHCWTDIKSNNAKKHRKKTSGVKKIEYHPSSIESKTRVFDLGQRSLTMVMVQFESLLLK